MDLTKTHRKDNPLTYQGRELEWFNFTSVKIELKLREDQLALH